MNETNNTDRYIGILNSHILPFIDYDRLLKSYETDMVYAKGILNWLHTAMVMAYDGEVLDEYAGDEGFVIIPGVIRGKESGKMCLALLELDLTSSGEHYGTAFLCQYGLLSQKAAYGTDTVLAAQAKEISRQIGAYDYGYTAKIPGDIHIDAARLPDAMKDILDGFWKHSTELLPDSASPVVGMGADGENIREEIRVLMNAVVIENQMMELMEDGGQYRPAHQRQAGWRLWQ